MTNRPITAPRVDELFFPVAGSMGLPARATATAKLTEKIVWAGSNLGSYEMAEEAIWQLSEQSISAGRIRRQVNQVGDSRLVERDEAVEQLQAMDLPSRRSGSAHREAPQVAVVMMDGGRYQRRDYFAARGEPKADSCQDEPKTHWRETKVGCLLSMTGEIHPDDPCARIPDTFAQATVVQEIAKAPGNSGSNAFSPELVGDLPRVSMATVCDNDVVPYKPPKLARARCRCQRPKLQ